MSLYNMLMGRNPFSPYLLAVIGITQQTAKEYPLGRIRDVTTNDAGDRVFILSRNYGEEWLHVDEALAKNPNYVRKFPDQDETFWTYEFSVPEDTLPYVKEMAAMSDNTPPMDRYRKLIEDFGKGVDNEATRNCMEVGKKLLGPVLDNMEKGGEYDQTIKHGDGEVQVFGFSPKKDEDGSGS